MAKKRRNDERGDNSPTNFDRVFELLELAPSGLHDVEPAAASLPSGLPEPLIDFYARCDGGRLFIESVEIARSTEAEPRGDHWYFGTIDGEDLLVDVRGKVWRSDESLDDLICEGTRIDRWLAGVVDAIGLLYDVEGEFEDGVFDEDGEVLPVVAERQLRAMLKRDPAAPAPRWRLAHVLLAQNSATEARTELEEVVSNEPGFAWGWLDLAKISEKIGELSGAADEARAAAEAAVAIDHPQTGYFYAQLARLASRAGDEVTRVTAARKAADLAPELKAAQLAGATESLADGDVASARGLIDLLRAVWPRDLAVLALAGQVDAAEN